MSKRRLIRAAALYALLHVLILAMPVSNGSADEGADAGYGMICGRVLDKETGEPLVGTNIMIVGEGKGGITDRAGRFRITGLSPGEYVIDFSYIGYRTERFDGVRIGAGSEVELDVALETEPLNIGEIIVTPGQFNVMGSQPAVKQTLTRQDLQTIPFGEDIYRAVTRLPGISSGDYSAKFTVRGGENEQVLVLLDGQELYEPFHLKDVDGGILSIIDAEAIEGVDLYTGGYPAEYGESMSGVFGMKSAGAGGVRFRTSLGISFMNARIMSEGRFDKDKGSWLLSLRRGYLDLVLSLMGEEDAPQPVYSDVLARVKYRAGDHTLSANIIHSRDKLSFVEDDDDESSTRYGNSYGWLTWTYVLNPQLFARTIASFGRIDHDRSGIGYFDDMESIEFVVEDENRVDLFGLKQDWYYEALDNLLLKWGAYFNYETAEYDYLSTVARRYPADGGGYTIKVDTTSANLSPEGERFGAYVTNRLRISEPLTAELGLRYDRNAYTDDSHFSPRVNAVYALGKQTFLRAGWGHFRQSQRMHQIKVAYGEKDFFPGQLSEHWVAGIEHTMRNGLNLRLEAYHKNNSNLRPSHRNLTNNIEIFPEVEQDVITMTFNGAEARGMEFYLKYDRGGKFSAWASYALAYAEDDVQGVTYHGTEYVMDDPIIPNRYDQRHTVYLDFNYRPNRKWHLNVSWQYHTGWPYTQKYLWSEEQPDGGVEYYAGWGELYGRNLPSYHRMDAQINRHFYLSSSRISLFLAVINIYDRANVRNVKYSHRLDSHGALYLVETEEYWFPLLPSLGISWTLMR